MDNKNPVKTRFFYTFCRDIARRSLKLIFGLKIYGSENVPETGSFIIASNHQSITDPPIIGSCCMREVFFAAKKELFKLPIIGKLIRILNAVPVKRTGYDRGMLLMMGKALEKGFGIVIFPEGTRNKDGKLRNPKAGVGLLAVKHNPAILPVYIENSRNLFACIIKRNLTIRFGKLFRLDLGKLKYLKEKEAYREASKIIMNSIAATGNVSPPK